MTPELAVMKTSFAVLNKKKLMYLLAIETKEPEGVGWFRCSGLLLIKLPDPGPI